MSEQELMLLQIGQVLSQVARPHRCGETIPVEGQANLQPAWGGQVPRRRRRPEAAA